MKQVSIYLAAYLYHTLMLHQSIALRRCGLQDLFVPKPPHSFDGIPLISSGSRLIQIRLRDPFLTFSYLDNPSPESQKCRPALSLSILRLEAGGGRFWVFFSGETGASRLQRKSQRKERNCNFSESSCDEEPFPLMARRTQREEPGPRYHARSFGRTSEN